MRIAVRFAAVGLGSFLLDTVVLWLLYATTRHLLLAVVVARVVSGATNFAANRWFVFDAAAQPWWPALARYLALAGLLLLGNAVLLSAFTGLGLPILVAKLVTEASLWCGSLLGQRLLVCARPRRFVVSREPVPV